MPYIITTLPEFKGDRAKGAGFKQNVSRRAVATLDEAFYALPDGLADTDMARLRFAVEEHGRGSIDPLPDGTMVEVERVSMNWIIGIAEDHGAQLDDDASDVECLDAYNGVAA